MFCWSGPLRGPIGAHRALVAAGHRLYSLGGGYVDFSDFCRPMRVYIFNTVALRWAKLPELSTGRRGEQRPPEVPTGRAGHSGVLVEDTVYVWGDLCTVDTRLYAFHVHAHRWLKTEVSGSAPEARCWHSACALGKVMYVHGGRPTPDTRHRNNDTYKLDTATMVWSSINTRGAPPPVTEGHSATIIGTKMFVFGGYVWTQVKDCHSDVRVFDTETDLWSSAAGLPEPHLAHTAFTHDGELFVFARHDTSRGLWKFNTTTFSWQKVEPKGRGPSKNDNMYCGVVGDRLVLFCKGLYILDLNPSLKTFCKLAVIRHGGLEQSQLPHDLKWELAAMTSGGNWYEVSGGNPWMQALYGDKWSQVEEGWNRQSVGTVSRWELVGGSWQRVRTGAHL